MEEEFDMVLLTDILIEVGYGHSDFIIKKVRKTYASMFTISEIKKLDWDWKKTMLKRDLIEIFYHVIQPNGEMYESPPIYVEIEEYRSRLRERKLKEIGI